MIFSKKAYTQIDKKKHFKNKIFVMEKTLSATCILVLVIALLYVSAYIQISHLIEQRCISRMEEGVNTATTEITTKLKRDSMTLNATAQILSSMDDFNKETIVKTLSAFTPLIQTRKIRILMPDNTIIEPDGATFEADESLDFEHIAALGEHVSNRITSVMDGNALVLRYYVPIVQNDKTAAILYGVTKLDDLHIYMNIENIYNASASVYIIDTENGDMILDTFHNSLGNVYDYSDRETKNGFNWEKEMQKLMDGKQGYVVFREQINNEWTYLYYTPTDINKWTVAVSVPEREAFANLFAIKKVLWIIAGLTSAAIVVYFIYMRKISKETIAKTVERAILKQKLKKAEIAERAKTMFLSNMSHDIRTPMNAIIGYTTLAETNIDNKKRVQEYHAKILSSSNHLLSLINDILDMSRIESGKLNIKEEECSISDIFRDMRNIIQTQMQSKQLKFFMDTLDVVDEDIFCDKLHLNQVLLNLLSNSIKFTPAGGSVSLSIAQLPNAPKGYASYEIRVKDTGIGMSEEFASHVFEPFEREQTSTVSGIQGTGLGLAITKNIIDAMGGSITLKTEQNKGSEFIIRIEFRLQDRSKQIDIIDELRGFHALVVDDSFVTCDNVTKMLTRIGMRTEWTMYGHEAVLRARQANNIGDDFYVYIIDWALPDLNGIEVTRQIREIVGDKVPIIIMTAYDWSAFEKEAREAGVTSFCNKPLFISDLRNTLMSIVENSSFPNNENILPEINQDIKGKRFLLVEDNELNREIASELLTESGFIIETAEDGTVAVDMVKNSAPGYYDLILMDVQMPKMNGYEATKVIRSLDDPQLSSIPIIAMTANAFEEDRKNAIDCGMNDHVSKPVDINKLLETLERVLNNKNHHD